MSKLLALAAIFTCWLPNLSLAQPPGMTEIDEAVAKMQIQEVMYRYALYHNTDRPEAYAGLFTEDADFFGQLHGRDAIYQMAVEEVENLGALGVTVHGDYRFGFLNTQVVNPVIDIIDATHATGIAYVQVVVPDIDNDNVPTILSVGTYQDEFRKVDGKWLIAKREYFSSQSNEALGAKLGLGPPPATDD